MKSVDRTILAIAALLILSLSLPGMAQKKAAPRQLVVLDTTMGAIKIELFTSKAPLTTKNFLDYVNSGFYNGTIVHRVDFVAAMGGYMEELMPKTPRAPIKNESKNGLKNMKGTLAMARYDAPDSATSQFFINLNDNSHLDASGGKYGYAVFGKVVEGMDVVEKIAKVKKGSQGSFYNVPLQTITVKSAKVVAK